MGSFRRAQTDGRGRIGLLHQLGNLDAALAGSGGTAALMVPPLREMVRAIRSMRRSG